MYCARYILYLLGWYTYEDLKGKMCTLVGIGAHPYRPAGILCQDHLSTSYSQMTVLIGSELGYVHHATGLGLHNRAQSPHNLTTDPFIVGPLYLTSAHHCSTIVSMSDGDTGISGLNHPPPSPKCLASWTCDSETMQAPCDDPLENTTRSALYAGQYNFSHDIIYTYIKMSWEYTHLWLREVGVGKQ